MGAGSSASRSALPRSAEDVLRSARMHCVVRLLLASAFLLAGRVALHGAAPVIISEFLAANSNTLADEDGEFEDWIELRNISGTPVNLEGWFLTDDPDEPEKWAFPSVTMPAGGFASPVARAMVAMRRGVFG